MEVTSTTVERVKGTVKIINAAERAQTVVVRDSVFR